MESILAEQNKPIPLKNLYRTQLIEKLEAEKLTKGTDKEEIEIRQVEISDGSSGVTQEITANKRYKKKQCLYS